MLARQRVFGNHLEFMVSQSLEPAVPLHGMER